MAKAATHIDKQYRLGGVWKKAYNDVASSLGGDGYSYYDIDVKKLVNPVTASKQTKVYLNLIVYVPKFQRHRASQHIKNNITNLEEILLLMAARLNHINQVIEPNLKKGKLVISDRFADSTFVYQGFVNGFGIKKIQKLHKDLLNNFLPTKTFLFKLPSNEIIKRLKKRR